MSTPSALNSKPTPRGPASVATPNATSPAAYLAYHNPKIHNSPHKPHRPHGGTASAAHTPLPASSPGALDSILHGLGRARTGALGASYNSKNTPGSEAAGGTPAATALTNPGAGLGLNIRGGSQSLGFDGSSYDAGGLAHGQGRSVESFSRKMHEIVELLGTRWGYVSQEGLVRCVARLGLDGMWDDGLGSGKSLGPDRRRMYIIAGKAFSVEVEWVGERVHGLVVDFPTATEKQKDGLKRAGEILKRDLKGWNAEGAVTYIGLESFAHNLERLARLDRLGVDKVSCFEALDGIHNSLIRLWDWEIERIQELRGSENTQAQNELEVLHQRSGRPAMHEGRKLGHRIDYFLDRRYGAAKMVPERSDTNDTVHPRWHATDTIYTLLLSCQPSTPNPFTSIRVTDNWIASDIAKDIPEEQSIDFNKPSWAVNWLDPPETLTGDEEQHEPLDIDATIRQATHSRHAAARFVAKLDPPITMPLVTAQEIFQLLDAPLDIEPRSYSSLIFPEHPATKTYNERIAKATATNNVRDLPQEEPQLTFRRLQKTYHKNGKVTRRIARYTLFQGETIYGKTIEELPFSHPSQLMIIMPYLRQWAYFGSMLRRSMGLKPQPNDSTKEEHTPQSVSTSSQSTNAQDTSRKDPPPVPNDVDDIPSDTDSESSSHTHFGTRRRPTSPALKPHDSRNKDPVASTLDSLSDSEPDLSDFSDSSDHEHDDDAMDIDRPKSHIRLQSHLQPTTSPKSSVDQTNAERIRKEAAPVDLGIGYNFITRGISLDVAPLYRDQRATITIGPNACVDVSVLGTKGPAEKSNREAVRVLGLAEDLSVLRAVLEFKGVDA